MIAMEDLQNMLNRLQSCMDENGDMLDCLHQLVPTFREAEQVNRDAQKKAAV